MRLVRHATGLSSLTALALAWAVLPSSASGADAPSGVQIVKGAAIAEKIERSAPSPGGRGGVFAEDADYRVHVAERDRPGQAELHDGDTDVWYVIAGGATLVTGGTMADASDTGPGEHRGASIRGGTEHAVAAGDVVTIRPGVPHWVKAVDGRLRYLVVKVHARPAAGGTRADFDPSLRPGLLDEGLPAFGLIGMAVGPERADGRLDLLAQRR